MNWPEMAAQEEAWSSMLEHLQEIHDQLPLQKVNRQKHAAAAARAASLPPMNADAPPFTPGQGGTSEEDKADMPSFIDSSDSGSKNNTPDSSSGRECSASDNSEDGSEAEERRAARNAHDGSRRAPSTRLRGRPVSYPMLPPFFLTSKKREHRRKARKTQ